MHGVFVSCNISVRCNHTDLLYIEAIFYWQIVLNSIRHVGDSENFIFYIDFLRV